MIFPAVSAILWYQDTGLENNAMPPIEKIVVKGTLADSAGARRDFEYWSGKTPVERVAAVEFLRRQYYGSATRLQRIIVTTQVDRIQNSGVRMKMLEAYSQAILNSDS